MIDGVSERERGRIIRLVYDGEMPQDIIDILVHKFGLKEKQQLELAVVIT